MPCVEIRKQVNFYESFFEYIRFTEVRLMSSNNGAGQKKLGKLTAAERIASIVDSGSFM